MKNENQSQRIYVRRVTNVRKAGHGTTTRVLVPRSHSTLLVTVELLAAPPVGERPPLAVPRLRRTTVYRSRPTTPPKNLPRCFFFATTRTVVGTLEYPTTCIFFSEVEVSIEGIAQPQATRDTSRASRYSPASRSHPRQRVRPASAEAVSPRDAVFSGALCFLCEVFAIAIN